MNNFWADNYVYYLYIYETFTNAYSFIFNLFDRLNNNSIEHRLKMHFFAFKGPYKEVWNIWASVSKYWRVNTGGISAGCIHLERVICAKLQMKSGGNCKKPASWRRRTKYRPATGVGQKSGRGWRNCKHGNWLIAEKWGSQTPLVGLQREVGRTARILGWERVIVIKMAKTRVEKDTEYVDVCVLRHPLDVLTTPAQICKNICTLLCARVRECISAFCLLFSFQSEQGGIHEAGFKSI